MISFSDPNRTLTGLHDMLTGWRSIRAQRRMRSSPAASSSPASMHSAPVAGPPPAAAPDTATVIGYRKLGDRIVPIFGEPAELADTAAQASANTAPSPSEARAEEAPPEAPPAGPEAQGPKCSPKAPPPPDFTPQAVEASAPRQRPAAPPTLDLPPPTPPPLVRAEEQAVTLERVLAQYTKLTEALLAQHAAMTEAIFAEHRRAQAQADLEQRQQIADLLAKHQITAEMASEHGQALTNLRELLAEQASAMQAEHARITDKIESIVDMVGMVGETVHQIAVVALQPKPLPLAVLPTRQGSTGSMVAAGSVDRSAQAPQSVATSAPRILPARPPSTEAVQPAPPAASAPSVQPPPARAETVQPAAPTPTLQATPEVAAPAVSVQAAPATNAAARPRPAAVPARGGPDPAPPVAMNTSRDESTLSRSLGCIPAAADVLSLVITPPTPRQLREAEAARERSRLDEALADRTLDDPAESADEPNTSEVRDA